MTKIGRRVPTIRRIDSTPKLEVLRQQAVQENVNRRKKYLEPLGIYVDFVKPTIYQGRKFWALGSRLYYERPPNETFHEFIVFVLCQTLGEEWRQSQLVLHANEQHFVYRCWIEYNRWGKKNALSKNKEGGLWVARPDGWTKALISLAFDIASLVHREHLPDGLLQRLKNKDQYQSVRYEIATAAVFARLGYKILFLDEQSVDTPHPEFIAEDLTGREKIAVEVKSKQREGVLHTEGQTQKPEELLWGDIQRLYRHALKQNPGNMPFIIFVDLNSPQTPGTHWKEKPWFKDIKKMMDKSHLNTPSKPDPSTAVVFTNYSYHYQADKEALLGEHLLTIPLYPAHKIKNVNFFTRLETALTHYGEIPNLDIDVGQ